MSHALTLLRALPVLFLQLLAAQMPADLQPAAPRRLPSEALRVPVHRASAATTADFGTWAVGPRFKASFHDGFAFYPELGTAYAQNLPLQWRTITVGLGAESLSVAAEPEIAISDWRVTMQHAGWREVYDVRADGVEQSFVIDEPPESAGDLVIRGAVTTRLSCAMCEAGHQELVFRDAAGLAILSYGAAFVVDAGGRRAPADTAFDGARIELRVDGAWLAGARFPVTLDPLTTTVLLNQTAGATIGSTDVCSELTGTQTRDTITAFSRIFSAADHDVFAILSKADFSDAIPIFSDVTPNLIDDHVSVAFVAGTANRWLIGWQRDTSPLHEIRVYFHNRGATIFNSGLARSFTSQAHHRRPDLGGTSGATGIMGIVVYEAEFQNGSANTQVLYTMIDAAVRQFGSTNGVGSPGGGFDAEAPSVNQTSHGNDGWVAVCQELNRNFAGSHWYVAGARVRAGGSAAHTPIAPSATDHLTQPQVAGSGATWLITCLRVAGLSARLQAIPITWAATSVAPALGPIQTIASVVLPSNTLANRGVAHDPLSGAFFAATWESASPFQRPPRTGASVARLSLNGKVIESASLLAGLSGNAVAPSVTYAAAQDSFPVAFGTDDAGQTLNGRVLQHPAGAGAGAFGYGTACGAAVIDGPRPWAGNQRYRLEVSAAPPNTATVLICGLLPGSIPLGSLGMTGCTFLVDPAQTLFSLPGATDAAGYGSFPLPLPDQPVVTGDLFFQYFYVAPLANPAGLAATGGLRTQVR